MKEKQHLKIYKMRNIDLVEVKRPIGLRNEMQEVIKNAMRRYEIQTLYDQ